MSKQYKFGVVCGRFQTVTEGHIKMIDIAKEMCEEIVIVIGSAQYSGTFKNPFSIYTREKMFKRLGYPNEDVKVMCLEDVSEENQSSKKYGEYLLDKISDTYNKMPDIIFHGSDYSLNDWFEGSIPVEDCIITRDNSSNITSNITATKARELMKTQSPEWYYLVPTQIWGMYDDLREELMKAKGYNSCQNFNAEKETQKIIQWIKNWMEENAPNKKCVVGVSGGKDSSVVAALCVEALGKENVIGVMLPNGEYGNESVAEAIIQKLGIKKYEIDIQYYVEQLIGDIAKNTRNISEQTYTNLPARLRMSILYAIAQSSNAFVVNTCNFSENYIGYSTKYGDSAGDFAPLHDYTATEVKQIGRVLGLDGFVDIPPTDDLCGKTDEENFGFTYEELDNYIRLGAISDQSIKERIDTMHEKNKFKLEPIPYPSAEF